MPPEPGVFSDWFSYWRLPNASADPDFKVNGCILDDVSNNTFTLFSPRL